MTAVLLPFLMSMLLGRTIDLTTYNVGGDIYDNEKYDEAIVKNFRSSYIVLQENAFPYTHMGLPVDIALRIKSGILSSSSGTMGLDGLLKETSWKQRSAVIAVSSYVQTIQRTLKEDAPLLQNWNSKIRDTQTHYANSIIYGGWSFIIYRFKCDIPGDAAIVRNTLTKSLGFQGELKSETVELWKKAVTAVEKNPEIRGKVNLQVQSYSTFPFEVQNLTSPDALLRAVSDIPNRVGSKGKPLFMELWPLHDLDEKYPVVEENHELDKELEQVDEMYDDVKNTKNSIMRWLKGSSATFTDAEEDKIGDLLSHLSACVKLFHKVASEASVYKDMDSKLIKSAIALYNSKLQHYANSYDRIFRRLKEEIEAECEDNFLHKIKGLLKVHDNERIDLGKVNGGLKECKSACLAVPNCRSIGYVDQMLSVEKDTRSQPPISKLVQKEKICYIYFRSSSTANVVVPKGPNVTGVYDRKCE